MHVYGKVKVCNDQEMSQSERMFHSNNRDGKIKKTKLTIKFVLILRKHIVNRVGSYFPIGGHSITRTSLKYENVHKVQTVQISKPNYKKENIRTIT